jgi:Na+/proline symporter/signal transduction histidine kinase
VGIELWTLFAVALTYLGALFLIAYATDAGWLPRSLVDHPAVYALSLGVYATSWTYYGSVGLASSSGFAFLTIYLGVTAAFLLGPYLLQPILRLCRDYQLASIADLLAFRFGGRATGFVVTIFMLIGILPYISLQIHAVAASTRVLTSEAAPAQLALLFCVLITIFAVLFGARHLTPRERHAGLVAAIAFESAIKLIALLVAGWFAVNQVFGGFDGISRWLADNPEEVSTLYAPVGTPLWSSLLLLSFCAAFLLPRQYHMTFVENERPASLKTAYWLFPLYLLLLNLPILPILWAGKYLSLPLAPDFHVLGMLNDKAIALLIYVGGLSAASAMIIVTTLALSYMCLNHLFLPVSIGAIGPDTNLYQRILWGKRVLIAGIIAAGYAFYLVIEVHEGLASLGLISFVAAVQLLPGVLGLLFWTRATQAGFITGLLAGAAVWFILLVMPLLTDSASISSVQRLIASLGFADTDVWSLSTFCSLVCNCTAFILVSMLTRLSTEERDAAVACTSDSMRPLTGLVTVPTVAEYTRQLASLLGREVADQEIQRALMVLKLQPGELKAYEMRLLHEQLERNLSGLLGPTLARLTLRGNLNLADQADHALTESLRAMELRLETSREQMRGVTKQLDDMRRYLRDVLQRLPIGVCSLGPGGEVLIWNAALEEISAIASVAARRGSVAELPAPWCDLISEFLASDRDQSLRQQADLGDAIKIINFHKSSIAVAPGWSAGGGVVLLVEDRTSLETLESELAHSERLASIGRLAAGVAHEIGNPLTGIASIAQNLQYESALDALPETSDDILGQVERIDTIVKSLLTFARSGAPIGALRERIDLRDSLDQALQLVRLREDAQQIIFNVEIDQSLPVAADAGQMVQIFVNLLNNACDVTAPGGQIDVFGSRQANQVQVRVQDRGCGIPAQQQSTVFEPFFTTKPVGQGTGLGLALVYSLVTDHGGRITIDPTVTSGTCFELLLPLAGDADGVAA